MNTKRKILIVIPSLIAGGAEKALINLLKNLDKNKYQIDLCVAEKKGFYLDQVPDEINIFHLFFNRFIRKFVIELHRRFNIGQPFKWLTRSTIQSNYDVGICFLDSVYSDMLIFLNERIEKSAVVLQSSYKSNNDLNKFIRGPYKERLIKRYKKIDTIVGVSDDAVNEFTSLVGEYDDLRVIHNPISRREIIKKSEAFDPGFSSDVINLIAVGSLLRVKGYKNLIKACALLKDSGSSFKLRILGKGPLEQELHALIQNFGLEDHVSLLGFKSNPYPYMLHSDIFVMSSSAEGLPTVLCEAMILEKPAVVTNCPGCRELVDYGTYGIMTQKNPGSLFEGLKLMAENSDKRCFYSKKSKERSKLFNIDRVISDYESILNKDEIKTSKDKSPLSRL